ncbi:CotH kinase family protein [Verrucomicrobiota bacterium sgz303538]
MSPHIVRLIALPVLLLCAQPVLAGTYGPQGFAFPDNTTALGDGTTISTSVAGAACVTGGALRLTAAGTGSTTSAFKIYNLDPSKPLQSFDATFKVRMTKSGTATPADGWSFNFGPIPSDNGAGEGGFVMPNGLVVSWDTYDNGGDPPGIRVLGNGVRVANSPRTFLYDTVFRSVSIHWDSDNGLNVTYDGSAIFTNLQVPGFTPASTGGSPAVPYRFAFSARTGGATEDMMLDDLSITTTPLVPVETGGPVITEFVANNSSSLEDEDTDASDWIEIYNGQNTSVSLNGWYLTNSAADLTMWQLPAVTLGPYGYKIIYASAKNRVNTAGQLHANFTLPKEGGYLALVRPDGATIATQFNYSAQAQDESFGEKGSARTLGYMYPSTPGAMNNSPQAAGPRAEELVWSRDGGLITGAVTVSIALPVTAGAVVRYTRDNTEPTLSSLLYSGPISVSSSTTIRARTFVPNQLPGPVSSKTFLLLDSTLTNFNGSGKPFSSNLPIIVLDSFGVPVDSYAAAGNRPYRLTYGVVIDANAQTGRATITDLPNFQGRGGTHVRGESSAGFDQKQYSWETWTNENSDKAVSILGMPSESDWVLYAPWSEKTLMRDVLVFGLMRKLRPDYMAVRAKHCEVFFNQAVSTSLGYSSYRGVYVLKEKIKIDKNRVDLAKLNGLTTDSARVSGGYIFRKDKPDTDSTGWTTATMGIGLQSYAPDFLNTQQLSYLQKYVNDFEATLPGSSSPPFRYGNYIEPDTFIDAQWFVEWTKQVDGYVFSTYFHKDRNGKMRAGPIWDFNISIGNASYSTGDTPTGWLYDTTNGVGQLWYPRLHLDTAYKLKHWDRYWELRRGLLANTAVLGEIDRYADILLDGFTGTVGNNAPSTIQNPVARHYRKYPRFGQQVWPNPAVSASFQTYQDEVNYMKNWLTTRLGWLDDQNRSGTGIYRPPVFSRSGGSVAAGTDLAITPYTGTAPSGYTYPSGQIYYTTNGADPRSSTGTPSGTLYSGPITLTTSAQVSARLYNAGVWSPLTSVTFIVDAVRASAGNLVVSEIMYNPTGPTASETAAGYTSGNDFEFIELQNISNATVDLSGVQIADAVAFTFAGADPSTLTLAPGGRLIVVGNRSAFTLRYGNNSAVKIAGEFTGNLSNSGELLTVRAADGAIIKQFTYGEAEPWPVDADGAGYSLVLNNPTTNPDPTLGTSWRSSSIPNGSPGLENSTSFTGSPTADSDGDGASDFLEYATGTRADDARSNPIPTITISPFTVDGVTRNYAKFQFRRNLAADGCSISVLFSSDLSSWQEASAVTYVSTKNNGDGTATVTYRSAQPINAGAAGLFFRVRVSQ